LNYTDIAIPDIAFELDLQYRDAVQILDKLQSVASAGGLEFGVKLSNTLEVENVRPVFAATQKTSYLSGRALHAITVNLAYALAEEFQGNLPISFSAGASCFNAPDLLAAGMPTITVCSDLLKTGGYLRLLDYLESVNTSFARAGAASIGEFILKSDGVRASGSNLKVAALHNLRRYAQKTRTDPDNMKGGFDTSHTKTSRVLEHFDCIAAPCVDRCPLDQNVPRYMNAVRQADINEAQRIIRKDNPLPCILGRVCDHLCEQACVRAHLDEPLAIRDIKRYVMDCQPDTAVRKPTSGSDKRVAIIGAGPGGMAAALELARAGAKVEIFEQHSYAGGMVGGAVPEYRLPQAIVDRDFAALNELGAQLHYGKRIGKHLRLSQLRRDGFDNIVIMVGAQLSKTLALEGEDCDGVIDALKFLRQSRENRALTIGERVGVIGAGDTAMDCARVARRQNSRQVMLIYRRSVDQMPADRAELAQLIDEGVEILEMSKPQSLVVEAGRLRALRCRRTEYARDRDASGRKIPHEVPDSDFEVPLDTLILAISQHAVLDFLEAEPIEINARGYIAVDPVTFETSVAGVYAGGDVANQGPASIVKAAAAGKAIAHSILRRRPLEPDMAERAPVDTAALLRRRSKRMRRLPTPQIPVRARNNFDEVTLTYSHQQARAEAARCLDCDQFCSICVGVCPNLALQTYETTPFEVRLPTLRFRNNQIQVGQGDSYRVRQSFQVAVLADFCNECGNCTTFCPTSGRPYRDKPRLYLDATDFARQQDNAFMLSRDGDRRALDARWKGADHRIELNGGLDYMTPTLRARINPLTFEIEHAEATGGEAIFSLEPCASMFVLLQGIQQSRPFLPCAIPDAVAAQGRIAHPGYEE
jgi:putative selenate reductase